jgi:hypothetical protein
MTDERIRKIIDDPAEYLDARETTVRTMLGDFYNRKMLATAVFVWVWALAVVAGATFCAVRFFNTDETRYQIMFAALFVVCVQFLSITKIFAWQIIHRNGILREIKRLELRIAELTGKADA